MLSNFKSSVVWPQIHILASLFANVTDYSGHGIAHLFFCQQLQRPLLLKLVDSVDITVEYRRSHLHLFCWCGFCCHDFIGVLDSLSADSGL